MRRSLIGTLAGTLAVIGVAAAQAQPMTGAADTTRSPLAPDSILHSRWNGPSDSSLVTVLLVRHAEKNTVMLGHDVPLSDAGARRAQALARVAQEAGVSAIYVTATRRARETAEPIAARIGDTLTVVQDIDETVARLRSRHWGRTVLVIGHSDNLPQIIEGLTGRTIPGFRAEFDVIYVVTLARNGRSSIVRLRYGEG